MRSTLRHVATWLVIAGLLSSTGSRVGAQYAPDTLKQMVAPIALYPDAVMLQVLMASCYPQEIVEADRWVRQNPGMTDAVRTTGLASKAWDASVSSLTAFPDLLGRMAGNLDWTKALGEAFLGQQKDVLDAIQAMRAMAKQAGSLASTQQQAVAVDQGGISIQSTSPSDVFLPYYDPSAVYGASWSVPAWDYPGMMGPWPGYAGGRLVAFGAGVAVGNAMYANANWANRSVTVNNNISTYSGYRGSVTTGATAPVAGNAWQYNPVHRQGVNFNNPALINARGGTVTYGSPVNAVRGYESPITPTPNTGRYWGGSQVTTPGLSTSAFQQTLQTQRQEVQAAARGATSLGASRGQYQRAAGMSGRPANLPGYEGSRGGYGGHRGGGFRGGGGRR